MAADDLSAWIDSGQLAHRVLEAIQEGVVIFDRELRYRYWNHFMERATGQTAAEILGKHALEVHSFWKDHQVGPILERALAGHHGAMKDFSLPQKRIGWAGWAAGNFAPLRNTKSDIVGVIGFFSDVTRRKRTEEALVANERRYRQLFEDNPQPMWVQDVENLNFLAVNEAALRHYGYTREEFLFLTLNELLAPAELAQPARHSVDSEAERDAIRYWRHSTKDGRVLEVEISSHVISFADRRAVLVVANDVTQRHRVLQDLRESELKYRTLIEAADTAIILTDAASGKVLEANRRAETLLGLPRHHIVGLHHDELQPPELLRKRDAAPKPAHAPGTAKHQSYIWHRAGRRIPVDVISSLIDVGTHKVIQHIYHDISERKRTEETLARRTRQLEVLSRANRQINVVLEIPVIFRTMVAAAMDLIQAEGGLAGQLENGQLVFSEYISRGQLQPISYRFESGRGVAGYVLASKLPYFTNEPLKDPFISPELQQAFKLRNLVNVPIVDGLGQLLGCLELHNTVYDRPIDETDLTMLEGLAATAAIALGHAHLIEARRQADARLEQSLAHYSSTLESIPDAILVVDTGGRITGFNQEFTRLWNMPRLILDSGLDEKALDFVLAQLEDSASFLVKVQDLYATPEAESHDYIRFKGGRVVERFSKPQRVAGRVVGRVWSFRETPIHPKPPE